MRRRAPRSSSLERVARINLSTPGAQGKPPAQPRGKDFSGLERRFATSRRAVVRRIRPRPARAVRASDASSCTVRAKARAASRRPRSPASLATAAANSREWISSPSPIGKFGMDRRHHARHVRDVARADRVARTGARFGEAEPLELASVAAGEREVREQRRRRALVLGDVERGARRERRTPRAGDDARRGVGQLARRRALAPRRAPRRARG